MDYTGSSARYWLNGRLENAVLFIPDEVSGEEVEANRLQAEATAPIS